MGVLVGTHAAQPVHTHHQRIIKMAGIDSVTFMNMRKSTPDLGEPVLVHSSSTKFWVNPETLPDVTTPSMISETAGNVSDYIKRLSANTFAAYGVGSDDCFAHDVGKKVKFTNVDVDRKGKREGRVEATTVAEVVVDKCECASLSIVPSPC